MASHLFSYLSGPAKNESIDLEKNATLHHNFLAFLAAAQHHHVDFLPVTWQSALEPFGKGATSKISETVVNVQMSLAFKRTSLSIVSQDSQPPVEEEQRVYRALISELMVLGNPIINAHPNILKLEGICWEIPANGTGVWPVLVFEKAPFGDLESFMASQIGRNLNFADKLGLCADVIEIMAFMHTCRTKFFVANIDIILICHRHHSWRY